MYVKNWVGVIINFAFRVRESVCSGRVDFEWKSSKVLKLKRPTVCGISSTD